MLQGESSSGVGGDGVVNVMSVLGHCRWMQCAEVLSKIVFRDGSSALLATVFANDKRCAGKNPPDRLYGE